MTTPLSGVNREYIECICDGHALRITHDTDPDWDYFEVAVLSVGKPAYSFGYRLRQIWNIIRTGQPYGDQIIFERKDFDRLKKIILDL